jgi:uncharacterized membrane protein YjjB (DUF3815 family)
MGRINFHFFDVSNYHLHGATFFARVIFGCFSNLIEKAAREIFAAGFL